MLKISRLNVPVLKLLLSIWLNTLTKTQMFSFLLFFFSSRRRHTRCLSDWSSDVCSSDLAAGSLFYSGGMALNDAFDAEIDARERPERPIPSGRVSRGTVLALGFGMLVVAQIGRASCRESVSVWGGAGCGRGGLGERVSSQ